MNELKYYFGLERNFKVNGNSTVDLSEVNPLDRNQRLHLNQTKQLTFLWQAVSFVALFLSPLLSYV